MTSLCLKCLSTEISSITTICSSLKQFWAFDASMSTCGPSLWTVLTARSLSNLLFSNFKPWLSLSAGPMTCLLILVTSLFPIPSAQKLHTYGMLYASNLSVSSPFIFAQVACHIPYTTTSLSALHFNQYPVGKPVSIYNTPGMNCPGLTVCQ